MQPRLYLPLAVIGVAVFGSAFIACNNFDTLSENYCSNVDASFCPHARSDSGISDSGLSDGGAPDGGGDAGAVDLFQIDSIVFPLTVENAQASAQIVVLNSSTILTAGPGLTVSTTGGPFSLGVSSDNDCSSYSSLQPQHSCNVEVLYTAEASTGAHPSGQLLVFADGFAGDAGLSATLGENLFLTVADGGEVDDNDGGVCRDHCTWVYPYQSTVTLTAPPQSRFGFESWTNDCASAGNNTSCSVYVDGGKSVGATYGSYNYAFVTQANVSTYFGASPPDRDCTAAADAGGLPGTYVIFISDPLGAFQRLQNGTGTQARGWIRPDGLPFMDTVDDAVHLGQVFYPPLADEHGVDVSGGSALFIPSSTYVDGGPYLSPDNCDNWSTGGTSQWLQYGDATRGARGWYTTVAEGGGLQFCPTSSVLFPYVLCMGVDQNIPLRVPKATGRMAFMTTGFFIPGADAGLNGADVLCNTEGQAVWSNRHFTAVLATDTQPASARFADAGSAVWVRPDGVMIGDAGTLFGTGALLASLNLSADGSTYFDAQVDNSGVWVGAGDIGYGPHTCGNWRDAGAEGLYNYPDQTMGWQPVGGIALVNCSATNNRLYCLEQ